MINMASVRYSSLLVSFLALLGCTIIQPAHAEKECERLKHTVEYTQEDAPRGFSKIMKAVTEELNKVLDGVIGAEVNWDGWDLHGRVGERLINCEVQRLASMIPSEVLQGREVFVNEQGQEVISQCFQLPFTIRDTNECTLPQGHEMRHRCQEPSICVNTIGSYECLCPRLDNSLPPNVFVQEDSRSHTYSIDVAGDSEVAFFEGLTLEHRSAWELAIRSPRSATCPSQPSTRGCCPEMAHGRDGQDCRQQFQCPLDPCSESTVIAASGNHSCAHNARCVRRGDPLEDPNHSCDCPDGLLGNGRTCRLTDAKPAPKVTFEGKPTEETIRNNYCGCTKPTVDACAGFPPCTNKHEVCVVGLNDRPSCGCKKGFIKHEQYGCVDERPPTLKLNEDPRGDRTLRLKQGDTYEEFSVRIQDGNVEDYSRQLKITYSEPTYGCLTKVGEFHVNYTLSTPWTDPSSVSISRRVIIEDIDECTLNVAKYESTCPELIPRCDTEEGAKCVNTIGSYTCECPKYTSGDGFRKDFPFSGFKPEGYQGGTSCVDTTKPTIELNGPSPKVFKICPCGGISGIMQDKSSADEELREAQREHYEHDIKELIKSTKGAELCADAGNTRPRPSNCVKAIDETHNGPVDLSSRVVVGEPVRKSSLHWVVPYDVKDDAGNEATTIWRDVIVEEVDFEAMESRIRDEVRVAKDAEIKNAVAKAVAEERKKNAKQSRFGMMTQECPACPKCDEIESQPSRYEDKGKLDMDACEKICEQRAQQCSLRDESIAVAILVALEQFLPSWVSLLVMGFAIAFSVFAVIACVSRLVLNPYSFANNYDYMSDREREEAMQKSVHYYSPGPQQQQQQQQQQALVVHQQQNSPPLVSPPNIFTSPPGGMQGGPPRASMSMNNNQGGFFLSASNTSGHGLFSPSSANGTPMQSNGTMNGNNNPNDPNGIYDTPGIILPSPRPGSELRRRSPGGFSPQGGAY